MTTFFIVPYEPTEWETATSELIIDPKRYRERLLEKWPKTQFWDPTTDWYVLEWSLCTEDWRGPICGLQKNLQVISLDTPLSEYIIWHRHLIPSEHTLYLTSESSWESLELTTETTEEDIGRFLREKT